MNHQKCISHNSTNKLPQFHLFFSSGPPGSLEFRKKAGGFHSHRTGTLNSLRKK